MLNYSAAHLIREIRVKIEHLYTAEVNALIDNYGISENGAQQIAYMAICELRADLMGAQLRKGQDNERDTETHRI